MDNAMTLVYGTVMAAALYTDAKSKIGRRKKLDAEIETATKEVEVLKEANLQRLRALGIESELVEEGFQLESELRRRRSNSRIRRSKSRDSGKQQQTLSTVTALEEQLSRESSQRQRQLLQDGFESKKLRLQRLLHRSIHSKLNQDNKRPAPSNSLAAVLSEHEARVKHNIKEYKQTQLVEDPGLHLGDALSLVDTAESLQLDKREALDDTPTRPRESEDPVSDEEVFLRSTSVNPFISERHSVNLEALLDPHVEPLLAGRSSNDIWADGDYNGAQGYWLQRLEISMSWFIYGLIRLFLNKHKDSSLSLDLGDNLMQIRYKDLDNINATMRDLEERADMMHGLNQDQGRAAHLGSPNFPQYHPQKRVQGFKELSKTHGLNEQVCDAFSQSRSFGQTLSKLCDLLMSSTCPPNIHTFNILITNFCRVQQFDFVPLVLKALSKSGITKNEITVAAIVRFHTAVKDEKRFLQDLDQLEARNGYGFASVNAVTSSQAKMWPELAAEPSWLPVMTMDSNGQLTRRQAQKFKVLRNKDVYDALIDGYLQFHRGRDAFMEFNRMLKSGFKPRFKNLAALLRQALYDNDFAVGHELSRYLFEEVQGEVQGSKADLVDAVYTLMQLWTDAKLSPNQSWDRQAEEHIVQLEAFCRRRDILQRPLLASDFQPLKDRELQVLRRRSEQVKRLENSPLKLKFDVDSLCDFSEDLEELGISAPFYPQAKNLTELVCRRLAALHEYHITKLGEYPSRVCANDEEIGFCVGYAAVRQVGFLTRDAIAKFQTNDKKAKRKRSTGPKPFAHVNQVTPAMELPPVSEDAQRTEAHAAFKTYRWIAHVPILQGTNLEESHQAIVGN